MKLRIREIRKLQGFSQQALAQKLDMDQGTFSRYETGEYKIRFSALCRIAKALDVHVTALFDTSEPLVPDVEMEEATHV